MGCSAAKNLTVEPINGSTLNGGPNGEVRKVSIPRRPSEVPTIVGEDPKTEVLDNVQNVQKTMNGLSFDIGFEEDNDESIIKKHPPKRLQKLEEQPQIDPNATLVKLQEKLDEAEIRRQQILQQRVASAKVRKALKRQNQTGDSGDFDNEDEENKLQVPGEN